MTARAGPLERRLLRSLSWAVLGACALLAANFAGRWWFWELSVPRAGFSGSPDDLLQARLALAWAAAALAAGYGFFRLIRPLPDIDRRAFVPLAVAAALACIPFGARLFFS